MSVPEASRCKNEREIEDIGGRKWAMCTDEGKSLVHCMSEIQSQTTI